MSHEFYDSEPYWLDLPTQRPKDTIAFYSELFGWQPHDMGEEYGHYTMMLKDGEQVCAINPMGAPGTARWELYFKVPDAHTMTKAVEAAGGTVTYEPADVGDLCTIARFTDPSGVAFSVSQPKEHTGAQVWDEIGAVTWIELISNDSATALHFYRQALSIDTELVNMGGSNYNLLSAPGAQRAFGGAAETAVDMGPRIWLPYFKVADCDATAEAMIRMGGSVGMKPMSIPNVGRVAVGHDPDGPTFGVISDE